MKGIVKIDDSSETHKFQQIIDSITNAIASKTLNIGDKLPSVNDLCKEHSISRVTVFKALTDLKEMGLINSIPNRGYYVAEGTKKVFMLIDTMKAYKEVLYHAFINKLNDDIIPDIQFHNYSIDVFKKLINESVGKYTRYIVMPFDNPEIKQILKLIPKDKLLVIDWVINADKENSILYQDFYNPVYNCLEDALHLIKKYNEFIFVYPEFTYHPIESVNMFVKFCEENQIKYKVIKKSKEFEVKAGQAFMTVSDRILSRFLEQCKEKKLEPGKEVGIIAYNETPMKKFIHKGITVISTDFTMLGEKAAEFANTGNPMNFCVPTKLIIRESL